MLNLDPEFDEDGICPGCTRQVFAYKNNAVRWNNELWHNRCALLKMHSLLTPHVPDAATPCDTCVHFQIIPHKVCATCPASPRR